MKRSTLSTLALAAFSLCCNLSSGQTPLPASQAVMPKQHASIFRTSCFDCHDSETQEGKLNLEELCFEISKDIATAEHWDNILAALNSKEMPPEDATQIPDDEKSAFLEDLSQQMVNARNVLGDSDGEITMRRLNRREYQNTLEALLGFRPDVSTLPDDDETGGFDTSGGSLFFSSDQFEQYRATATRALEYALISKPRPEPKTVRLEGETISKANIEKSAEKKAAYAQAKAFLEQDEGPPAEFGFTTPEQARNVFEKHDYTLAVYDLYFFDRPESKTGTILLPGRHNGPVKRMPRLVVASWYPGGTYKLRIKAASYGDAKDHERYIQVQFRSGKNEFTDLDGLAKVTGSVQEPVLIELQLRNPVGIKGSFRVKQRNYEEPWPYKIDMQWKAKNGVGRLPAVWVDYVEVEGPFFDERLHQLPRMLEKKRDQSDQEYARTVITRFATKAFRGKPPNPEYIDNLVRYYLNRRASGDDSRKAMIEPLDDNVGRIATFLDENGLRENTLIIFTSDNGQNVSRNDQLRGKKGYIYEDGIRVPTCVNWPGKIDARRTSTAISCLDFFPTFMDLAGIECDGVLDGHSITGLFQGDPEPLRTRPLFWHLASCNKHGTFSVIRKNDHKLIQFLADGRIERFDLVADPTEEHNQAEANPGLAKELLGELVPWRRVNRVPLPPGSPGSSFC